MNGARVRVLEGKVQGDMTARAERYRDDWGLGSLSLEGETAGAVFYACHGPGGEAALLKVLKPNATPFEAGGFAYLARQDARHVVRLWAHGAGGAVMARLDGPRLLDLIDDGRAEDALECQVDLTCALLRARVDGAGLTPLDEVLAECIAMPLDVVPSWARDVIPAAQSITREMLAERVGWCALHGDLHPRNILGHADQWRAIDARGLWGPAAFDFANLFLNPWDRPEVIFEAGRMERVAGRVGEALACNAREVVAAALANALFYAQGAFAQGRGRHPTRVMRALLALL